MTKRPIVHIEFAARDRVESADFYHQMFGWKVEQMPEMNYATFDTAEGLGGGFNPITEDNPKGTILVYILSEDINADLVRIEQLGGKALIKKSEIAGMGWYGVFLDPAGNKVALYTPIGQMPPEQQS